MSDANSRRELSPLKSALIAMEDLQNRLESIQRYGEGQLDYWE